MCAFWGLGFSLTFLGKKKEAASFSRFARREEENQI
tara:strand:+ start:857 stop:964 length:108 start_codon:yes stop_codon:yes gene_type:complete